MGWPRQTSSVTLLAPSGNSPFICRRSSKRPPLANGRKSVPRRAGVSTRPTSTALGVPASNTPAAPGSPGTESQAPSTEASETSPDAGRRRTESSTTGSSPAVTSPKSTSTNPLEAVPPGGVTKGITVGVRQEAPPSTAAKALLSRTPPHAVTANSATTERRRFNARNPRWKPASGQPSALPPPPPAPPGGLQASVPGSSPARQGRHAPTGRKGQGRVGLGAGRSAFRREASPRQ
jgi:hypothetical protein